MNEPDNKSNQAQFSRRSFLKTSSTAMAGGALLGALPVERFALGASPGETLKLALVGCGGRRSGAPRQAPSTSGGGKEIASADALKDPDGGSPEKSKTQRKSKREEAQENKIIGFDSF